MFKSSPAISHLPHAVLWTIAVVNAIFAALHVLQIAGAHTAKKGAEGGLSYTYQHLDYPYSWPIEPVDDVAMTLEETVHFAMNVSDPFAEEEWRQTTLMLDIGHGRVRLGPEHHTYIVTHFHQMHCMRVFQHAITGFSGDDESHSDEEHVQHCLNYLRQTFLCQAEVSLEKGDPFARDWDTDRVGGTLVCEDWQKIYANFEQNFDEWEEWVKVWN